MTITNIQTASAYPGKGVNVTLDKTNIADMQAFALLYTEMEVTSDTSGDKGLIYSIDRYGGSFIVMPLQPNFTFMGSEPYKLKTTDTISFNGGQVTPLPPLAPIVENPTLSSLNLRIDVPDGNPPTTEYAIENTNIGLYVQGDGSLGTTPFYQTAFFWNSPFVTVPGLLPGTQYFFRAISNDGVNTTIGPLGSNTTVTPVVPTLWISPDPVNFGSTPLNVPSATKTFQIVGFLLDGSDVTMNSFDFISGNSTISFSLNPAGPFLTILTFSGYGSGIPATTIYAKYDPDGQIGQNDGEIGLTGGGVGGFYAGAFVIAT